MFKQRSMSVFVFDTCNPPICRLHELKNGRYTGISGLVSKGTTTKFFCYFRETLAAAAAAAVGDGMIFMSSEEIVHGAYTSK